MAAFASENSLRERVKEVVETDILRASAAQSPRAWMVLVLDKEASRVLSPVLGMYDLMEERVTLVESLELKRQPFREMNVIYVAAASDVSCEAIAADWSKREAPYGDAHCFFLSRLSEYQLGVLGKQRELSARLRTLNEVNLEFLALEAQTYSLSGIEADAFSVAAALEGRAHQAERDVGRKLATLCATLGEAAPVVRYRGGNGRAQRVASAVAEEVAAYGAALKKANNNNNNNNNSNNPSAHGGNSRGVATVLIVDRADDVLTPLMHEYTYQALVHDMLLVEGEARDRVEFLSKGKKKEVAMLSERDPLWVELRHEHVAKVIDALRRRVSDIVANNKGAAQLQKGGGSDLALTDIASALKKMPEFQAATAQLNKHMTLAHECLTKFHAAGLLEISQLEQALATGVDDEGEKCKPASLLGEVLRLIRLKATPPDARLRLACCYVVACKGRLNSADREHLLDALAATNANAVGGRSAVASPALLKETLIVVAKQVAEAGGVATQLDAERLKAAAAKAAKGRSSASSAEDRRGSAKLNFAAFRSAMKAGFSSTPGASTPSKKAHGGGDDDDEAVASSRYDVPLKGLLELLVDDKLPLDGYPVAPAANAAAHSTSGAQPAKLAAASVRKHANKFTTATKRKTFTGSRIIVCVLGGCSYSEIRAAYDLSNTTNREILIGGSTLLTPQVFLEGLGATSAF